MIAHSSDQRNWRALAAAVAADDRSGATALLALSVQALRASREEGRAAVEEAARVLCAAQPSMAAIWNAAAAAVSDAEDAGGRLALVDARARRASTAIARVAADTMSAVPDATSSALKVVTFSASGTVASVLEAVALRRPVRVACGEGRPAGEGYAFAADLAKRGLEVDLFTDGGLSAALDDAEAVIVGADALAGDWLMNKVGTRLLIATAHVLGVAVYVAASREKLAGPRLAEALRTKDGPPAQIGGSLPTPAGVSVRNPYFERVPWSLVTAWIGDMGVLAPSDLPAATQAHERALEPGPLLRLLGREI